MANKRTAAKLKAVALMRSATIHEIKQSESIGGQYATIAAYAKTQEIEIVKTFESTARDPKATLWEVLDYCRSNPAIEYLLVSDVSRLSRNFADFTSYKAIFEKYGVTIWPATKSDFDFDTPMGHFMETMAHALGRLENAARSERTIAGMKQRAESGYSVQQPPYGYIRSETPGLFKRGADAWNLGQILKELANGLLTVQEAATKLGTSEFLDSDPKPLSIAKLKRIASNPFYAGFISFQGILYKGKHEPLLTPEEQQRLIELFGQ